jgi:hypothetical protein
MRKITTIGIVLAFSLIILSSGTVVHGLAFPHLIQIEGLQEAELITAREEVICKIRNTKKINSNPATEKTIHTFFPLDLFKKSITQNFSPKSDLFIRHCSLLI